MTASVVKNWAGEATPTEVEFSLQTARPESKGHVVWLALKRQLNNRRQGTHSTLTKAEVRGGGKKPYKQKGTGRARMGSMRTPLRRGGGVIFGPKPRDYDLAMNRKERRLALRTILQERAGDIIVVEDFIQQLEQPKTKELVLALKRWGVAPGEKVLLILESKQDTPYRSGRNVPYLRIITAQNLNVHDLLHADQIIMTAPAVALVHEIFQPKPPMLLEEVFHA
ncbi:50S ribosomal protein L4 [Candidatus Cyanaurora vandensis]|uniref:50S ribosomal protein L4 n=1 Tax=Candidatus Cyanaurora vandensis TaxID=2714958 RepID=UPI00257E2211|nr:50S ribosomal protein L4 [Candidatus Cyanaurora vandensis]